ncbi:MAG: hypothetical protein AMXMBFR78_17810 [Rubrivivax sp.]|jgi:O-antigen ligase
MPLGFVLALLVSCGWLLLAFVFLAVLTPTDTPFALMVKIGLALGPLLLLWGLSAASRGGQKALAAVFIVIVVITELSIRQRAFEDTSADPQNLLKMALWGVGLLVGLLNWRVLREALRQPATLALMLTTVWFGVTAIYSPIPLYTFGSAVSLLAVVIFGAVARRSINEPLLIKGPAVALTLLLLLGLALYVVAPERALARTEGGTILRLAAPFGTPNQLGRAAAIVLMLMAMGWIRRDVGPRSVLLWIAVPVALACLYLSQSRTALAALVVALAMVYAVKRPARGLLLAAALALTGLAFSVFDLNLSDLAAIISRTGRVSELTTMTGRTEIWSAVWAATLEQPYFGYGHGSSKLLIPQLYRTFWGWTSTHAHNMWLQTWFGAGIVGVALLASTMLLQLRYCLRTRDLASLMVLAFVFVYGMAEASHLSAAPSILSVIWAVWITGQRSEGAGQQGPAGARAAGFAQPHRQGLAAATPSRARP